MKKLSNTVEDFLKKLSEKYGESVEDLKIQLEETIKNVSKDEKFAGLSGEQKSNLARNRLNLSKSKEQASKAIPWEGIVIGIGDLIDTVAKARKATEAAFRADALKTMKGWIYNEVLVLADKDGHPLYPETDMNKRFGRANKPLPEHSWLRSIYLVARPIDPKTKQVGPYKKTLMSMNGNSAIDMSSILQMETTKFKGINKTNDEDNKNNVYRINSSTFTKFERTEIKDFPPIETILPAIDTYKQLGEVETYHEQNKDNKIRWVITEGSVAALNLEANPKSGNKSMMITDESMLYSTTDKSGIWCWIPVDRNIKLDFGVESRIYIVGKTSRGTARDAQGNRLEGVPGDVSINVYGLYVPELFKVAPNEPLTEKSLLPQPETPKNW